MGSERRDGKLSKKNKGGGRGGRTITKGTEAMDGTMEEERTGGIREKKRREGGREGGR